MRQQYKSLAAASVYACTHRRPGLVQVLAVGQSRRDAALRSKRMRRSEVLLSAVEGPADAGQPANSAAAIMDAVAALAACRDVDSAQHLSALQTVRRVLSTGVHKTLLRHGKGT